MLPAQLQPSPQIALKKNGCLAGWGQRKLLMAQWLGCRPAASLSHDKPICWFTYFVSANWLWRKEVSVESAHAEATCSINPSLTALWECGNRGGRWQEHICQDMGMGGNMGALSLLVAALCPAVKWNLMLIWIMLALAWFNRATTVKTQQSRQFDLAATWTYKYYMQNHEKIRKEHIFTKQKPKAST